MSASSQPIYHRLLRLARDLRLSAVLLILWIIPPAAAKGPITSALGAAGTDDGAERARDRAAKAYIIHLPGIAGPMRFDSRFGEGLVVGQAGSEVEIFDWVGTRRGLLALYGVEENRRQARRLADRIIDLKARQPDRALIITAHSGGTAVAAWALEMLGEGTEGKKATERRGDEATQGSETSRDREGAVFSDPESSRDQHSTQRVATESGEATDQAGPGSATPLPPGGRGAERVRERGGEGLEEGSSAAGSVSSPARETSSTARDLSDAREGSTHAHSSAPLVDGVLFIASGLSSDYDLSPMLRQVRGRLFHLSSKHDNLILAAGTAVFGTLDRKNGLAAGKTGFYLPEGVAPEAYERFVEVPYDRAWAEYGHYGDHEGMMTTSFAAKVAADLVRASLGVNVELPTTRPAQPAPVKPATDEVQSTVEAAGQQ